MRSVKILIVFIVIFVFNACKSVGVNDSPDNSNREKGSFFIKIAQNDVPEEVDQITAKIERDGFNTELKKLEVVDGYVSTSFENIFIGKWHLSVTAYSSENDPLYFGESDVIIETGSNQINLTLNPVTGSLEIVLNFNTLSGNKLVAYYPFNGNAHDESGNGNNGTVYGAQLTEDRFGNDNSAYHFDGINDYIDVGYNLKMNFPVSISAWVKLDTLSTPVGIFLNDFNDNSYYGIQLLIGTTSLAAVMYGDGGLIGPQSRITCSGNTTLLTDYWYHIVATINGSGSMQIYLNNELEILNYTGYGNEMMYSDGSARIGISDGDQHGPPYYFNGSIDDIKIYNKVLTENEISELFNAQP